MAGEMHRRPDQAAGLRALAAKLQRGRKVPDLLIAAAAEEAKLRVLHSDRDVDLISKVTGQPCERVVPAGSID